MPEVLASAVIDAPADDVWRVVRDFDGLPAWHPAIATSSLTAGASAAEVGAQRTLALGDGGSVVERLVALDDTDRRLVYAIVESPFPVSGYRSTMRVVPVTVDGTSFVEWTLTFDCDPDDADRLRALFRDDVFTTGLRGLAQQWAPKSDS